MFIQFRPWIDCDRNCEFCYQKSEDRHTSIEEKRQALMILSATIHNPVKGCDTIGLIGGELFSFKGLYREWMCVAETIRNTGDVRKVYIASHLIGDIEDLLDFAGMLNKEVWICTSYDSSNRFRDECEYNTWLENIKACQKEGHKVVVNAVLSNEFIHDDKFIVPEGVDFKLQAYFAGEKWLYGEYEKDVSTAEYNEDLKQKISDLPSRAEVLKWYMDHPEVAKDYATYDGKHCIQLWDYDAESKKYAPSDFICMSYVADCGHPYLAYCYSDSDKCTMCDARRTIDG